MKLFEILLTFRFGNKKVASTECLNSRLFSNNFLVKSFLMYGASAYTLAIKAIKMLRWHLHWDFESSVLNISWREHLRKQQLYGNIPALSTTTKESHMRFSGHCHKRKEELVSHLLLWTPRQGRASVRIPSKIYIKLFAEVVINEIHGRKNTIGLNNQHDQCR